jgi:hypothetical protein
MISPPPSIRPYLTDFSATVYPTLSHGAHMSIGMAMGFLFLGGGTKTFATDNGSVAALLIAIYPRFPQVGSG